MAARREGGGIEPFDRLVRQVMTWEPYASTNAFEPHWSEVAEPFNWGFTRHDLAALLERLTAHEPRPRLDP